MYFKVTFSNNYCGCDEEHYIECNNEEEAGEWLNEEIYNYAFFEPDARFVDPDDYETDEEYEIEVECYQDGIFENSCYEEITKEEYEENKNED